MSTILGIAPTYFALAVTLIIGLIIYERLGWRLGGILVYPLVIVFGLLDPKILIAFGAASVIVYWLGEWMQAKTFLYGRRVLYAYICISVFVTGYMMLLMDLAYYGIVLAIMPGILAFNVHREGNPRKSAIQFAVVVIPGYLFAHIGLMAFDFHGGLFEYVSAAKGFSSTVPVELHGSTTGLALASSKGAFMDNMVEIDSGLDDFDLAENQNDLELQHGEAHMSFESNGFNDNFEAQPNAGNEGHGVDNCDSPNNGNGQNNHHHNSNGNGYGHIKHGDDCE